jgi:2-methylaconitate cis-trans-isomerase PrpF
MAPLPPAPQGMVRIEHPSGSILIDLDADFSDGRQNLRRAALVRTARRIFEGSVCVPEKVWAGHRVAAREPAAA